MPSPAHRLSQRFRIDPLPDAPRSRLRPAPAALWLYLEGDMAAWQLHRLRVESPRECLNVFHPGLFRDFSHHLALRKNFSLAQLPRATTAFVSHSGFLHLCCNGVTLLHQDGDQVPAQTLVDLRPALRAGSNSITVTLNRVEAPPAFWMQGKICSTDATWEASADDFHFFPPETAPWPEPHLFPHQQRLPTTRLRPREKNGNLHDFGVELIGWPQAKISRGAGSIALHPGESPEEANNDDPQHREQPVAIHAARPGAIVRGSKAALRYLRVESDPTLSVADVACDVEYRPATAQGAFACSNETLTRIWQHAAYTLRLCMREFFVDGLKRDRLPWIGDLYVSIASNAFSFADRNIVRHTLSALAPPDPARCHVNGILDYTLDWLLCLQLYHLYFDDAAFVHASWPTVEKILAALAEQEDAHGFLHARAGDWIFIDWAAMDKRGAVAAVQMLYVMALDATALLAAQTGRADRASQLRRQAGRLRLRCRCAFWSSAAGAFVTNLHRGKPSREITRHAAIFAILSGVADPRQKAALWKNILANPAIPETGTPYLRFFENLATARLGRRDEMLRHIETYWGGMLRAGATTFWEAWDPRQDWTGNLAFYGRPFANSHCHAWASGPVFLLSAELWGLRPTQPGWRAIRLAKTLPNLNWAHATCPTPFGEIRLAARQGKITARLPRGIALETRPPASREVLFRTLPPARLSAS